MTQNELLVDFFEKLPNNIKEEDFEALVTSIKNDPTYLWVDGHYSNLMGQALLLKLIVHFYLIQLLPFLISNSIPIFRAPIVLLSPIYLDFFPRHLFTIKEPSAASFDYGVNDFRRLRCAFAAGRVRIHFFRRMKIVIQLRQL